MSTELDAPGNTTAPPTPGTHPRSPALAAVRRAAPVCLALGVATLCSGLIAYGVGHADGAQRPQSAVQRGAPAPLPASVTPPSAPDAQPSPEEATDFREGLGPSDPVVVEGARRWFATGVPAEFSDLRIDPALSASKSHPGVDCSAAIGDRIYEATVSRSGVNVFWLVARRRGTGWTIHTGVDHNAMKPAAFERTIAMCRDALLKEKARDAANRQAWADVPGGSPAR